VSKRDKLEIEPKVSNIYFPEKTIQFVSSGCTILDCVLGGGYPLGRIVNIVGDRSTAKTALATEAVINFLRQFPEGAAYYRETEAAYDKNYATSMGMPIDKVNFGDEDEPLTTVEDLSNQRNLGFMWLIALMPCLMKLKWKLRGRLAMGCKSQSC
jgi:hypothetical protein